MEFDEWWKQYCEFKPSDRVTYAAREAWNASRAYFDCAEILKAERDACIAAIDAENNCGCGVPCDCFSANHAKWAIKMRSNA